MDKEIIYIIVLSLSYFVGYYVRGYQDALTFYKRLGMSMDEALNFLEIELQEFEKQFQDENVDDDVEEDE
jgi:hypothetical protein